MIVLFDLLSSLVGANQISNLSPVAESVPKLETSLLFEALKQHELFVSCPLLIEEREIKFIDDIVFGGELALIGKA